MQRQTESTALVFELHNDTDDPPHVELVTSLLGGPCGDIHATTSLAADSLLINATSSCSYKSTLRTIGTKAVRAHVIRVVVFVALRDRWIILRLEDS